MFDPYSPATYLAHVQEIEDDDPAEDFETIFDDGYLVIVRRNGVYAAQVETPVDMTDLGWQLAEMGFITDELIACEGGVMEMRLRPLGVLDLPEPEPAYNIMAESHAQQKERVHA